METVRQQSLWAERLIGELFGSFALLALVLWQTHLPRRPTDLPEDAQAPVAPGRPPLEAALDAERRQLLRRAIEDLLGISVKTAKSQVSRARPRLTAILAEHYPDLESRLAQR